MTRGGRVPRGSAFTRAGASVESRLRLLDGLRVAIEESGYRHVTITDIVAKARASRRTFYEVFDTKDDAFFALVEELNHALAVDMSEGLDPTADFEAQVARSVSIYFAHIARSPRAFLSSIRELPSMGERADLVVRRNVDEFVEVLERITDNAEFRAGPVSRWLAVMIMGAIDQLVVEVLEAGRHIDEAYELAVAAMISLYAVDVDAGRVRRHQAMPDSAL